MPGFTADGSVENFKRRRQTELKHGRIAMLATMGYITPEQLAVHVGQWLSSLRRLCSAHHVCVYNHRDQCSPVQKRGIIRKFGT